jgi:hypothetical protein
MVGAAWLTLRQAQEALRNGRLEEAHGLLTHDSVQGHKRSWELQQQLASGFVARGERYLKQDDLVGAWNDLLHAEQVTASLPAASKLRQELARRGLAEVRGLLETGQPDRAADAAALLRSRGVHQTDLLVLQEVAKDWALAREVAGRGDFNRALEAVERVRGRTRLARLDEFQADLRRRRESFGPLLVQLHEAIDNGLWREVVRLTDDVLALAPQHAEARKARARAWQAIEPATVAAAHGQPAARATLPSEVGTRPPEAPAAPQRYLLWIDGVGGYLVCLGNRVTLGQAIPEATVEVPLVADVSRLHARITREAEGYLLEAVRPLLVNGHAVEHALLQSDDRITLGATCQLQFRQPVPVSASARIDLVSGHRLALALDGVILMADTLVLGPGKHVHVAVPDVKQPVVLFRYKDGLAVRCGGNFAVNGQPCHERGDLTPKATVQGEDFAFSVEPAGTRMGRM